MEAWVATSSFFAVAPNVDHILFLARSLGHGGAERQLALLAKGLAARGHSVTVAVFFGGGVHARELGAAGIRVVDLGKRGRWDVLPFLVRLGRFLRRERPAILHSYLAVPNILAALLRPLLPDTRLVWGLRASNVDLSRYDQLARLAYWLERRLSGRPDRIIANSLAGKRYAIDHGFPVEKITVIPNGIDTEHYRFQAEARTRVRAEWGLSEDDIVIGICARLDPMKGYEILIKALVQLRRDWPQAHLVCVGAGPLAYQNQLCRLAPNAGIVWTGERDDMAAVYSAFDIATSASLFGEGFSNAIAEAMSCTRPCVVTDVGDSASIVADTGIVVPPGDAQTLSRCLAKLLAMSAEERHASGEHARQRIVEQFGVANLVERTQLALGLA